MNVKDMIETTGIRHKLVPTPSVDWPPQPKMIAKRFFGLPGCRDLVTILTLFYHLTDPSTGLRKKLMGILQ